jgi:hypothetical protein
MVVRDLIPILPGSTDFTTHFMDLAIIHLIIQDFTTVPGVITILSGTVLLSILV